MNINITNQHINSMFKNEPLVSIVIATYRRDVALQRALISLSKQTYKNIEIIVVDDNADFIWNKKVTETLNGITFGNAGEVIYINNYKNKGSAGSRNIGINKASGVYVTFLDDDDIYLPNKIKNQVENIRLDNADFSITDLCLYDENEKLIEVRRRNYLTNVDKYNKNLLNYHLMYHLTGTDSLMFKREYLLDIGGFPSIDIGDEFYLMQRAIEAGGKLNYLPKCDIKAYVHKNTIGLSSGDSKINGEIALFEYKKKFFSKLEKKDIRYIKMRHYAVLAYTEIRRKRIFRFMNYSIKAFVSSPISFIKLFLQRK